MDDDKPSRKKFTTYAIGYFHIDLAKVQTEGKLYLYVAIDRTSKFAFVQLVERATMQRTATAPPVRFRGHPFDRACWQHGIKHQLTKPKHPWTNGQVERMNRTIKEATIKRYHYDNHDQLRSRRGDFVAAYNFARRLKTLRGLTPTKSAAGQCRGCGSQIDKMTSVAQTASCPRTTCCLRVFFRQFLTNI